MTGIYKIFFIGNNSIFYIGSAVDINKRKIRHRHQLKKGIHKNKYLQRLYNKHGAQSLSFEIIELCEPNILIEREQYFINALSPKINILKIAGSCIGFKHSIKTKKYLSGINKGKKMTAEQNKKNSLAQIGNKNSLGAKRTPEFIDQLKKIKQRKVKNKVTGEIIESIGVAADIIGLKYQTLYAKLSGRNFNNTNFIFP